MSTSPVDRLTERQRECLRLLFAHHKPGQIATELGISTDRVNQILKSAREKLGVSRSIEAAIMLAEAERPLSQNVGDLNVGLSTIGRKEDEAVSSDEETARRTIDTLAEAPTPFHEGHAPTSSPPLWPMPTSDRPFNELTWYQKFGWALAIALAATVLAGAMVSLQNAIH